jgi:hypothetical protein
MPEPTGWQFWWTWAAEAATGIGTMGAVIVALFGGWLRAHLAAPRLEIRLDNRNGIYVPTVLDAGGEKIDTFSRWYHLRVENKRRWSPANEVRVLLLKFEQRDAAGQYQTTWVGELPLQWSNQHITPLAPTIGPAYDCVLCSVVKHPSGQHTLSLYPLIRPFHLTTSWQGKAEFALTLQARSLDSDSNVFRAAVAWDGHWIDDTLEMARHLVVKASSDLDMPSTAALPSRKGWIRN